MVPNVCMFDDRSRSVIFIYRVIYILKCLNAEVFLTDNLIILKLKISVVFIINVVTWCNCSKNDIYPVICSTHISQRLN